MNIPKLFTILKAGTDQIMGDAAYRSWFYGADCTLCKHANWSVQRKGMD